MQNDWICDESWRLYIIHTLYWTGSLLGVVIVGVIADAFGRIKAIILIHILGGLAGVATLFTYDQHIVLFALVRALAGFVVLSQGIFPRQILHLMRR